MSNVHDESQEASKQIAIIALGASLIGLIVVSYYKPEASSTLIGLGAAIVTALAAVVKK